MHNPSIIDLHSWCSSWSCQLNLNGSVCIYVTHNSIWCFNYRGWLVPLIAFGNLLGPLFHQLCVLFERSKFRVFIRWCNTIIQNIIRFFKTVFQFITKLSAGNTSMYSDSREVLLLQHTLRHIPIKIISSTTKPISSCIFYTSWTKCGAGSGLWRLKIFLFLSLPH